MSRMMTTLLVLWCLAGFLGSGMPAVNAHSEFKKMFEEEYTTLKITCNACHEKGKKKDERNEFGQAIHKKVETEKFSEELKKITDKEEKKKYMEDTVLPAIKTAFKDVVDNDKNDAGDKWSDLIKDGKLPGTTPKKD